MPLIISGQKCCQPSCLFALHPFPTLMNLCFEDVASCASRVLDPCGNGFIWPYCTISTFRGVMHPSVPDECKPILLSGTQRIPFPSPLKKIKMPKKLKGSDAHLEDERLMNKASSWESLAAGRGNKPKRLRLRWSLHLGYPFPETFAEVKFVAFLATCKSTWLPTPRRPCGFKVMLLYSL